MNKGYSMRNKQYWMIVLSLGLASSFVFAAFYSFQPLLPIFTEEFSISVSFSSLSMSLPTLSLMSGLIILGFLSDRKGRVLIIKLSLILSIVPFIAMPYIHSFWHMIFIRIIQGFTLAGVPATALAFIVEEIEARSSQFATALYISCNALGGMAGRVLTAYLSEHLNWQSSIWIITAFGVIVFLFVLIALPQSKNYTPSEVRIVEDLKGFSFHLKNPKLLVLFGLGVLLQVTFTGVWTYLPFHLKQEPFSLSMKTISFLYFAYAFGIIGAPIASWLANRFTLERVRTSAIIILIAGVAFTLSSSLAILILGLCVMCFGFFTAHSLTASSVSSTATYLKGSASSLYLVAYYIGVASGSTLLSPLWVIWQWKGIIFFTITLLAIYLIILRAILIKRGQSPTSLTR